MSDGHTPSEHLATALTDALVEVGLLRADKREGIATKIAYGKMTVQDWQAEIEFAEEKAASE